MAAIRSKVQCSRPILHKRPQLALLCSFEQLTLRQYLSSKFVTDHFDEFCCLGFLTVAEIEGNRDNSDCIP